MSGFTLPKEEWLELPGWIIVSQGVVDPNTITFNKPGSYGTRILNSWEEAVSTSSYVLLEISREAYKEIEDNLVAGGYDHCFTTDPLDPSRPRCVMTGIAVTPIKPEPTIIKPDHCDGCDVELNNLTTGIIMMGNSLGHKQRVCSNCCDVLSKQGWREMGRAK